MIKQNLLIVLIGLFFSSSIYAQNTTLDNYDRKGIYLRTEIWRGTVFVKNGKIRPVGFAFKHLRPEFENTPNVLPIFKKAQRNEKISLAVGILGLVGATAGAITASRAIDDQGYLISERQYKQGVGLILGSAILSAAINIPLKIRARQHLDDAIWLRNRTLLER